MNFKFGLLLLLVLSFACQPQKESLNLQLEGTWKLLSSVHIKKDTVIHNDTPGTSMIKIINDTHFAFFQHNVDKNDSTKVFGAGGGAYTLKDKTYTEHLEYCSYREYEGNDFEFTIEFHGDTLIQTGIEKLEDLGIADENLLLVEKYIRMK